MGVTNPKNLLSKFSTLVQGKKNNDKKVKLISWFLRPGLCTGKIWIINESTNYPLGWARYMNILEHEIQHHYRNIIEQ